MKRLFAVLFLYFAAHFVHAQEFPKLSLSDFTTDHQKIDTAANAIVLYEVGRTELEYIESESALMVVHHRKVRYKIFNKDGAKYANVELPLYRYGSKFEFTRDIEASTFNLVNSKIEETEMQKSAVFNEKSHEYLQKVKFTLPNIKDNSILEISYKTYSPGINTYKKWEFQTDIPKLYSEYVAIIPASFEYNVTLKGHLPLSDTKSTLLSKYFLLGGVRNDCSKMQYIMKDIPAFKEESHMLARVNYISAITFELESYINNIGARTNYTRTWENIDTELMNEKNFGGQLKNKSAFKEVVPGIINGKSSNVDKAKAIYDYVQKNIQWNNVGGLYAENGVKKSMETKRGNIADVNLSLIAAMRAAEIEAYPVLFATRDRGIPSYIHPVLADFNGVLCLVKIDGKDYLLDATEKNLPFGQLSIRSINDRGRVIYEKRKSDWVQLANDIPSKANYNILAELSPDGKLKGTIRIQRSGLRAFDKRREVNSFPSIEEYEEHRAENSASMKIVKIKFENLEEYNNDLIELIDFELDASRNMQGNQFVFNPLIYDRMTKNPFLLEERNYHVDFGASLVDSHQINIKFPAGYQVNNSPKNTAMALPENAARYTFRSAFEDNTLMLQQSLSLNHPIYSPEEYFHLKEFFSRIIEQQASTFHFKKI